MGALVLNQVLFATDFSLASEAAFRYASALADRFNARLYVLHVIPSTEMPLERENSDAMRQLRQALSAEQQDYIIAALPGDPSRRIIEKARQLEVDLVVLGVHHGAPSPLTRDIVQEVCESSPCPVICVPVPAPRELHESSRFWE